MLNKLKIEFKELFFSYFFTELSHSCLSKIFVKVYIVMVSLKRHKKTRAFVFILSITYAFFQSLHYFKHKF